MRAFYRLAVLVFLLASGGSFGAPAPKTQAKLLFAEEVARPGETVMAALQLRMPEKWHTYWRASGDSGAPAKISWTLPDGWSAGEILWPPPEKLKTDDLVTYVYHTEVFL